MAGFDWLPGEGIFSQLFNRAALIIIARGGPDIREQRPPFADAIEAELARRGQVPPPPPPVLPTPPIAAPPPPIPPLPPPIIALPPVPAVPLPTPPIAPPLQTGGEILQDLLNRPVSYSRPATVNPDFERLLKKPPLSEFERLIQGRTFLPKGGAARGAARILTGAARILGSQAVGVLGGVLWPTEVGEAILSPRDLERIEQRRRGPRRRPRTLPRGQRPPPPPLSPVTVTAAPLPAPARPPRPLPAPIPAPAASPLPSSAPRPASRPTSRPAPAPAPLPSGRPNLLPYALPLLYPFLTGGHRNPISEPLPLSFSSPLPGTDILSPFLGDILSPAPLPSPAPLTGFQPQPLPLMQPPPADPCKCTTTRKPRKPKKPRVICYAGEYRERASGLTKDRRRKIPCQ